MVGSGAWYSYHVVKNVMCPETIIVVAVNHLYWIWIARVGKLSHNRKCLPPQAKQFNVPKKMHRMTNVIILFPRGTQLLSKMVHVGELSYDRKLLPAHAQQFLQCKI